jgi:AcrR family transcriptional regulator
MIAGLLPEPALPTRSKFPPVKARVVDESLVHRRRQQIVGAAVALFSDEGYDRTTVQEIAAKAGVSTGLIYQYVEDKDDILLLSILSVIEAYNREIPAALEGVDDPLERFRVAVGTYCRVVDRLRKATVLSYRSTRSLPPEQRRLIMQAEVQTNGLIAATIEECVACGVFRAIDVEFLTHQAVMLAHSWALKHWRLSRQYTIDQYIDEGLALYLRVCLKAQ